MMTDPTDPEALPPAPAAETQARPAIPPLPEEPPPADAWATFRRTWNEDMKHIRTAIERASSTQAPPQAPTQSTPNAGGLPVTFANVERMTRLKELVRQLPAKQQQVYSEQYKDGPASEAELAERVRSAEMLARLADVAAPTPEVGGSPSQQGVPGQPTMAEYLVLKQSPEGQARIAREKHLWSWPLR